MKKRFICALLLLALLCALAACGSQSMYVGDAEIAEETPEAEETEKAEVIQSRLSMYVAEQS